MTGAMADMALLLKEIKSRAPDSVCEAQRGVDLYCAHRDRTGWRPYFGIGKSVPITGRGGSRGEGGLGGQIPSFGGPPNFIKRKKKLRVCVPIRCILVLKVRGQPKFDFT